ncbi:hypothetical protein H2248_008485 [Termitomyces sp. 'cryptogamus']|nr:hypothetical protein H2248_008485 [Termitomyces sp. 'cryptogamus']
MFKRVQKRRRKREEEEELGLDEDMKQVLGINDTDSEESASDSDDSGSDGAESSSNEKDQDLDEQDRLFDQFQFQEESEEEAEIPVISVREALRDPVYIISLEPSVKGCIVCPGKILKGAKMVELHRASNAHQRRMKQFAALASDVSPQTTAWDLLSKQEAIKSEKQSPDTPSETSKRAQKRESRAALRKMRRNKQKALAKAKKVAGMESSTASAESTTSPVTEPPKRNKKPMNRHPPHLPPLDLRRHLVKSERRVLLRLRGLLLSELRLHEQKRQK